jgi:hypothetical protein
LKTSHTPAGVSKKLCHMFSVLLYINEYLPKVLSFRQKSADPNEKYRPSVPFTKFFFLIVYLLFRKNPPKIHHQNHKDKDFDLFISHKFNLSSSSRTAVDSFTVYVSLKFSKITKGKLYVVWLVGQHGSLVLEPWTFDPWSIHPCNI